MFAILIASFLLAIIFALSLKRPEKRKKRRTVFVETSGPVEKLDGSVQTAEPGFCLTGQENANNQTVRLHHERRHKIFVSNNTSEEVTKVIVVRD